MLCCGYRVSLPLGCVFLRFPPHSTFLHEVPPRSVVRLPVRLAYPTIGPPTAVLNRIIGRDASLQSRQSIHREDARQTSPSFLQNRQVYHDLLARGEKTAQIHAGTTAAPFLQRGV